MAKNASDLRVQKLATAFGLVDLTHALEQERPRRQHDAGAASGLRHWRTRTPPRTRPASDRAPFRPPNGDTRRPRFSPSASRTLARAGLSRDRERAAPSIHAEQLQQIQNADLLQVPAHVPALGHRRARTQRQSVHAPNDVLEFTRVELVRVQFALRQRVVQAEDHHPRKQRICCEFGLEPAARQNFRGPRSRLPAEPRGRDPRRLPRCRRWPPRGHARRSLEASAPSASKSDSTTKIERAISRPT